MIVVLGIMILAIMIIIVMDIMTRIMIGIMMPIRLYGSYLIISSILVLIVMSEVIVSDRVLHKHLKR